MTEREHPLRDGGRVLVRRLTEADIDGVAEAFGRMSEHSRRLRFLGPKSHLSAAELRYLTDVDGHDHEALVAIDPDSRRGVGIARFVRDAEHLDRAEVAVAVIDQWQRRGVATLLLTLLSCRARNEGVRYLTAFVAHENQTMQELLTRLGAPVRLRGSSAEAAEYELEVAPRGIGRQLRGAAGDRGGTPASPGAAVP